MGSSGGWSRLRRSNGCEHGGVQDCYGLFTDCIVVDREEDCLPAM